MSPDQLREALSDRIIATVAERTGLNYFTVLRIANGTTKNPGYSTMAKLERYLKGKK